MVEFNFGRERPPMNDKTAIFNQMKQKILQIQDPSQRYENLSV